MRANDETIELLTLPPDEIGWSEESFDLALRFVMRTANLSEVKDMRAWLINNVAKDAFWAFSREMAYGGIFKRTILLGFRSFEPSAMQAAYNYVKLNPPKNMAARNALAIAETVILVLIASCFIGFILYTLIANIIK